MTTSGSEICPIPADTPNIAPSHRSILPLSGTRHAGYLPRLLLIGVSVSVSIGHRPCENSKCCRIRGYLDPYPIGDRGLKRILCDRILRTRFCAEFSHSLCPFLPTLLFQFCLFRFRRTLVASTFGACYQAF